MFCNLFPLTSNFVVNLKNDTLLLVSPFRFIALRRLQAEHDVPDQMPAEMTALAITEGRREGFSLAKFFASHPAIEGRIAALEALQIPNDVPANGSLWGNR